MEELSVPTSFSRRDFLRVGAGMTGLVVLSACVPAAAPQAQTGGGQGAAAAPVELEVWTGWTEAMASNIELILGNFNKSQTKVVAKHVVVPDSMTQKLLAAVSAGNPPATAIVFGAAIAYQLAAQKALLALDEVGVPAQVSALKKWMLPAIWDLGVYDGKFYYASMWNQCMGVFVNNKLAQAQGVDLATPPKTLEDLTDVWEKLTTYDGDGNIDVLGGDFQWVEMVLGRFLGQYVSADGTKITANDPNNVRAIQWIADWWKRIGVEKLQKYNASLAGRSERSAGQDPFLSGLRATYVTGPWQFDTINRYKPEGFEFTVWPLPQPAGQEKKGMYTYGDGWIIPVGSKDPAGAWDIISTLTGAAGDLDAYTSLFEVWLCVNGPVAEAMMDYPKFQKNVMAKCPGYGDVFLADLYDSNQYLYPPKVPTSSSYQSLMDSEAAKVWLGEKGAQEAMDAVTVSAQKELDTWLAQNKG
jgi:ABC-type glycerol-3-phosphate transport system substrate-binding protein